MGTLTHVLEESAGLLDTSQTYWADVLAAKAGKEATLKLAEGPYLEMQEVPVFARLVFRYFSFYDSSRTPGDPLFLFCSG